MRLNLIGAGHVAQTLAHLLVKHQLVNLGGVYNRTKKHALAAIEFIGQGMFCETITDLPRATITLIATADDSITDACAAFCQNQSVQTGDILFHCSGALTSDCLKLAKQKGCLIASVHPMRSFKQPALSIQEYAGTYCAMEGDESALAVLSSLFKSIGSTVHVIAQDKKALYHAAGIFASNYLVTLAQQAFDCLTEAGVSDDIAKPLMLSLMQSTLNNIATVKQPKSALTGPALRGDVATINLHMNAFTKPKQRELYRVLLDETKLL